MEPSLTELRLRLTEAKLARLIAAAEYAADLLTEHGLAVWTKDLRTAIEEAKR